MWYVHRLRYELKTGLIFNIAETHYRQRIIKIDIQKELTNIGHSMRLRSPSFRFSIRCFFIFGHAEYGVQIRTNPNRNMFNSFPLKHRKLSWLILTKETIFIVIGRGGKWTSLQESKKCCSHVSI